MANLAFDLDGVLYDWTRCAYNELVVYWQVKMPYEEFWCDGGVSFKNEEWWDQFVRIPHLYSQYVPNKKVVEFLNGLSKKHNIYYITSRPQEVKLATQNWLRRYNFPGVENLIFTKDKVAVANSLGIQYFFEDRPSYYNALKDCCKVFVISQPWNMGKENGLTTLNCVTDAKGLL